MAALHILAWLPWQLTATPRTQHVSIFRHHSSPNTFGGVYSLPPFLLLKRAPKVYSLSILDTFLSKGSFFNKFSQYDH
jgi:hypothetical protein